MGANGPEVLDAQAAHYRLEVERIAIAVGLRFHGGCLGSFWVWKYGGGFREAGSMQKAPLLLAKCGASVSLLALELRRPAPRNHEVA